MISAVLLQLRSRINALSPLDRLPPEVLLNIFELFVHPSCNDSVLHLNSDERISTPVRTRQLLTITHVCRRWREVSLNTATLWTRADDFKPAQLDAFLERSRDAAISLHLQAERAGTLTRFLAKCGHRLKHLDITLHTDSLSRVPTLQAFRAPNLQSLTLVSQEDLDVDPGDPEPVLFCDRVSSLRALAVDPAYICIPSNEFPHLTHLYLAKVSSRFLSRDVLSILLQLLSNTPALQYLHIEGLSRKASSTVAARTASLRSLRGLTCGTSDLQSALCLLNIIDIPADVAIRLDRLECFAPDHVSLAQPLPCQALLASFTRLEVATEGEELHLVADGARSGLWMQVQCVGGDWGEWLARLCTMFPLSSVTTLQASAVDKHVIPSLLRQLPRLTTVAVHFNAGPLDEDDEAPPHELASSLYASLNVDLPLLEVLVLGAKASHPDKLSPADLISMAAGRLGKGRPLQRLVVDLLDFWPDMGVRGPVSPDIDLFRAAFAPAAEYVGNLQLLEHAGACEFEMGGMWTIPEAERYWRIPADETPCYRLFW